MKSKDVISKESLEKNGKLPKKFPKEHKICRICSTNSKGEFLPIAIDVLEHYGQDVFIKNICKICKEMIKNNVIVSCVGTKKDGRPCDSFTVVDSKEAQKKLPSIQNGDIITVSSCPSCDKEKGFKIVRVERAI